jgi:hypothetical protein
MAFQFPASPTDGQRITNTFTGQVYVFTGSAWAGLNPQSASLSQQTVVPLQIGDVPPTTLVSTGSLWFNSDNLTLNVRYQDVDGGQWVGITAAPPLESETASFAKAAATYNLPNTNTNTWVLLGTWNTLQNGATLYARVVAHAGFNAQTNQNQVTELYFKTSNGSSSQPGAAGGSFLGDGLAARNQALGTAVLSPETIRIVQVSTTQYAIYGFFNASFIDNSTYQIQITGGTAWTHSGTTTAAPTGTYINITPNAGDTPPTREYRRSQTFNLPNASDTIISWDILDTDSIQNLTQASGVITNTANYTRTFIFDYQAGAGTSSNIIEHNIFITKNGTPTGVNRIATNVINPVNNASAIHRLSATITMAPNDTIRCYEYVTSVSAGVWQASPGIFGNDAGRTTRLKITEL